MINLDAMLDTAEKHARNSLVGSRKAKNLAPFYHLVDRDDKNVIIPVSWTNQLQKQLAVRKIKKIAQECGAKVALIAAEGWMRTLSPAEDANSIDPIRHHPHRQEIVSLAITDGYTTKQRILLINRSKTGKITSLTTHLSAGPEATIKSPLLDGIITPGG